MPGTTFRNSGTPTTRKCTTCGAWMYDDQCSNEWCESHYDDMSGMNEEDTFLDDFEDFNDE